MHCRWCEAVVEDIWRWCPECGGEVHHGPPAPDYVVEWAVPSDRPSALAGDDQEPLTTV